jgi:hypothetical protein
MEKELLKSHAMAELLSVSPRGLANLKRQGMPYQQVLGVCWYNPTRVYEWLAQFERSGIPGKRYQRNPAVLKPDGMEQKE